MKAYVLAAGYATRMYPLTRDVPKALLDVGGAPVLTHIVSRLRELEELTELVLVTNERFAAQFEAWRAQRGGHLPITVLNDGTTSDEHRLGAIGDLKFALDRIPLGGEDAVVAAGDNLFDFDLRAIHRKFRKRGQPVLIVRQVANDEKPSRYNEVTLEPDGRVSRFREKPVRPETGLSAIALYFLTGAALELVGEYLEDGNPDAPGHFLAWLVERVPCYAERLPGPWYDIGSVEHLESARARFGAIRRAAFQAPSS